MLALIKIAQGLLVLAGQLDDLKKKYPQLNLDPLDSLKPKYYGWAVKQLLAGADIVKVAEILEQFEKNQVRLKEKDINKYKDLSSVNQALQDLGQSVGQIKATGSKKLYDDANYILLRLESKQACIQYGSATKWCITWKEQNHFNRYSMLGIKFYIWINKNLLDYDHINDVGDPLKKVAININPSDVKPEHGSYNTLPDGRYIQVWNSSDVTVEPSSVPGLELILPLILKDSLTAKSHKDNIKDNPEKLINHPDEYVREKVANRIDSKYLPKMIHDSAKQVRYTVAYRIDSKYLPEMMNDNYSEVRRVVALRIDLKYLPQMMKDLPSVRMQVAQRIDPKYLPEMMKDEVAYIRMEVARRIDLKYLPEMVKDKDGDVKYTAAERLIRYHTLLKK